MTDGPDFRLDEDVVSLEELSDSLADRERDGISSLHDTSEEAGDEAELADRFDLDEREAREAGVALDGGTRDEPRLD
jgi:hypothetical protein